VAEERKEKKPLIEAILGRTDGLDILAEITGEKRPERKEEAREAAPDTFGGMLQSLPMLIMLPAIMPLLQQMLTQTLAASTINVRVESATSIIPIDISASTAIVPIEIKASDVTLNVNIASSTATLNVTIQSSQVALEVKIIDPQVFAVVIQDVVEGVAFDVVITRVESDVRFDVNIANVGEGVTFDVNIANVGEDVTFNVNVLGGNINVNITNISGDVVFNVRPTGDAVFVVKPDTGVIFDIRPTGDAVFVIRPEAGIRFDVNIKDATGVRFDVNVIGGTVNVEISESLVDLKIYTPSGKWVVSPEVLVTYAVNPYRTVWPGVEETIISAEGYRGRLKQIGGELVTADNPFSILYNVRLRIYVDGYLRVDLRLDEIDFLNGRTAYWLWSALDSALANNLSPPFNCAKYDTSPERWLIMPFFSNPAAAVTMMVYDRSSHLLTRVGFYLKLDVDFANRIEVRIYNEDPSNAVGVMMTALLGEYVWPEA